MRRSQVHGQVDYWYHSVTAGDPTKRTVLHPAHTAALPS